MTEHLSSDKMFSKLPLSAQIEQYIESLTEKEKKGYHIAKNHLGSSFQMEKSIGFKEYVKARNEVSAGP